MWQSIVKFIISELIQAGLKALRDYRALQKKKKEDYILVKDVLSEKDPKERARRVRDLLNS